MLTATSATHSVASSSSTIEDRNATRSADIVVLPVRVAEFGAPVPPAPLAAQRTQCGQPGEQVEQLGGQRGHRRERLAALPRVSRPIRIMKTGMSGSVTAMIAADDRSCSAMTATSTVGGTTTASISAGR